MESYEILSHNSVFYNNQQIHANQYKEDIHKHRIFCLDGHQMIFINGEIKKKHFRHVASNQEKCCNPDKNNIWHKTIQNLFDKTKQQITIGGNITDVLLNDKAVLEIQHSPISKQAVQQRNKNYSKFGKLTIWWIDCSEYEFQNIQVNSRHNVKNSILNSLYDQQVPVYVDLISEIWQVVIIKRHDDNKLFIQFVKKYSRQELVEFLNNHNGIYDEVFKKMDTCKNCQKQTILHHNFNICQLCYNQERKVCLEQCVHLNKVRQAGAGNAKTYTIVKQALDNLHIYENILFLVKSNGTKQIIIDKINEVMADYPENYTQWQKGASYPYLNVYYIQFNKQNKQTSIIIATVDSFFCSLGCQNNLKMKKTEYSPFDFNYIANQIGLNQNFTEQIFYKKILIDNQDFDTLFILDEAQDLNIDYCDAMFNLFKHYNMDFLIVGDKLQTIYIDTYNSISPMQKYQQILEQQYPGQSVEISENICNRLQYGRNGQSNQNMITFINNFIHFEQFGLQNIQNKTVIMKQDDVKIFQHHSLFYSNYEQIDENIKIIMDIFRQRCDFDNTLLPQDFHIITSSLKKIKILPQLESEISLFWIQELQKRQQINETYQQLLIENPVFCKLHISETDGLINLGYSVNMTRIYSIHASKGEGRQISIILGLDQDSLELHSTVFGDLKYESLLHVAITRQKRYLFIGFSQSYGDVYNRLYKFMQNNEQSIMSTGINSIQNDKFFKIKENYIYNYLVNNNIKQFDNQTNMYKNSLSYLFGDNQYTLQQLEKILLEDMSSMIQNYDISQPDIDMDDYELRDILFKYNIKQNLCTIKIQNNYLIKDLFYMGNIFDNKNPLEKVYTMKEYRCKIEQKNKMKRKHAENNQKCPKQNDCDCRKKILLTNERNITIQQINCDVETLFGIMYNSKKSGFLHLTCPAQLLIVIFLIDQHKYRITPSKLYYMMSKIRRGLFKIDQCQCVYCQKLIKNQDTEFEQFYKQMFNPQIIQDLITILNQIKPQQLQDKQISKELPQQISKEIKIKNEISLYDEQTQTVIYVKQRLTEFNFRELLFKSLIDCYILSENNQLNTIIVSTNNQNEKNSDGSKYANKFHINITDKKNAIEYLVTMCYIKYFDNIFNQLLDVIQNQRNNDNFKDRLSDKQSSVYDYIDEKIDDEFLEHINYHKQYCLLNIYLKKNRRDFDKILKKDY